MRRAISYMAIGIVLVTIGAGAFIYSGFYNVGADDAHTRPIYYVLETLRAHSIKAHARDITVPNLSDEKLILKGAGQYAAMCTNCHLMPGKGNSEFRAGLYPQPPNLTLTRVNPQEAFWVVKHGIKMSGMPAWGSTHDDETIWSVVAFMQRLPDLSPAQYKELVRKAPPDEDMEGMEMDASTHSEHHHH
ncbi:MAG: cytochrome c [Betaproteobacteria bacterium]|nr:cytochrome c [Betaproteobacteria bacterium]